MLRNKKTLKSYCFYPQNYQDDTINGNWKQYKKDIHKRVI